MRLIIALLLLIPLPVSAQADCGDGLPCGRLACPPWCVPEFPELVSPTPMPTAAATFTATATATIDPLVTPSATPTPTATATEYNQDTVFTQAAPVMATLQNVVGGTPIQVLDASGTPVNLQSSMATAAAGAAGLFSYTNKLLTPNYWGALWPLIAFMLLVMSLIVFFKANTFFLPIVAALFGIVRKAAQLIADFIPGL